MEKLSSGFEQTVERVSYVTYFGYCIAHVPEEVPYEHGALWVGAVEHALMPRLLFANKASLDDSARTQKYTGLDVAGREAGASISIGYMAESYIDFGPCLMFAPIFVLGLFYGAVYRLFVFGKREQVLGMAGASAILVFGAYNIETSNIKLVGGNVVSVMVMAIFYRRFGGAFMRGVGGPLAELCGENPKAELRRPKNGMRSLRRNNSL
jgi:hypothetical protein